ncbi:MAG: hypothetical protein WA071_02125 [Undibacterium umbellatum]|uniref:hypothetical protein n=1 Tax=Undibacterium umbellatum TaxID=2762300 RepID=UPI003BB54F3C
MKNENFNYGDEMSLSEAQLGLHGLARLVDGLSIDTEVNVMSLLLDGVMTSSSICHDGAQPSLCIVAYQHEPEMPSCQSIAAQMKLQFVQTAEECWDCLWHAELGCQVLIRYISLAELAEDVDILDAILDTADRLLLAGQSDTSTDAELLPP